MPQTILASLYTPFPLTDNKFQNSLSRGDKGRLGFYDSSLIFTTSTIWQVWSLLHWVMIVWQRLYHGVAFFSHTLFSNKPSECADNLLSRRHISAETLLHIRLSIGQRKRSNTCDTVMFVRLEPRGPWVLSTPCTWWTEKKQRRYQECEGFSLSNEKEKYEKFSWALFEVKVARVSCPGKGHSVALNSWASL